MMMNDENAADTVRHGKALDEWMSAHCWYYFNRANIHHYYESQKNVSFIFCSSGWNELAVYYLASWEFILELCYVVLK